MPLSPGTRLGPYEILIPLGAGGMGEVWKARDTRLDRIVAIKTVSGPFSDRFEREARAISALNHPHICALYDVGEHEGAGYLVMEYVEGAPLKGPLPLDQGLKYAAQICDALDAAHRKGIVHRDLKPDNILITKAGVKLLDFGLAKALEPAAAGPTGSPSAIRHEAEASVTEALTGAHLVLGTPQYMAPEQIEGRDADARTDLFAFGCVLYELLTGQKAFAGKTPSSTMAAILATEPRPMKELQPVTPASVEHIVRRCLAKDPDDRWQSARDLKVELEWIAESGGGSASSIADGGASQALETAALRRAARHRRALVGAGTLVLAALAGAIGGWTLKPQPKVTAHVLRTLVSVAPADQLRALPLDQSTGEGRPSRTAMVLSPDGRSIVFSAVRGDRQQLYLRMLDQLEATPIPGTEDAAGPFLSPDGTSVGFWAGGALKKVALTGGGPATTICETPGTYGASWGSNDTIAFARQAGGLWRVFAAGGAPEPLTTLDAARGDVSHRLPQILPGNQAVLFTVTHTQSVLGYDASVAVQSLVTGERKILVDDGADARYVPTGHLVYVRRGTLLAVPFDLDRLAVAGGSVALVGDLMQAVNMQFGFLNSGAGQLSVSASGSLAYLPGGIVPDPERTLTWVDRTGVGHLAGAPRRYVAPRLSPDGQRVAVGLNSARDENIWIEDIQRGTETRLTSDGRNAWPVWTPDGKHIAFGSAVTGNVNLFWTAADGSGTPERLTTSEHRQWAGSWTPDGQTLAFVDESPTTHNDIWVLSLNGDRKPHPIRQTRFEESYPVFSPDGRWLAYVSDESGRMEAYVQPYPGPGSRQQVSTGGASAPAWSGDGRELFFLAPRVPPPVDSQVAAGGLATQAVLIGRSDVRMMAVAVTAGPTFAAGTPRMLFEGRYLNNGPTRGYDVTNDGRRFLMIQEKERAPIKASQIILVQNWFEELKRRVPTR